jgi:hypothetical protein
LGIFGASGFAVTTLGGWLFDLSSSLIIKLNLEVITFFPNLEFRLFQFCQLAFSELQVLDSQQVELSVELFVYRYQA